MVDTVRTLAALQALFADNVIEDISPQDLRDFLVSALGVYAIIYVNDGAVAQTGVTTTAVLMTGFDTNGINSDATPDHTGDKITINTDGDYLCVFQCSFSGDNNTTFIFHIRIDSVAQPFGAHRKLNASGDSGSGIALGLLTLSATDVVTVFVESDSGGGAAFTPIDASLTVLRIG